VLQWRLEKRSAEKFVAVCRIVLSLCAESRYMSYVDLSTLSVLHARC